MKVSLSNHDHAPVLHGALVACLPEREQTVFEGMHVNCKETSGTMHGTQSVVTSQGSLHTHAVD